MTASDGDRTPHPRSGRPAAVGGRRAYRSVVRSRGRQLAVPVTVAALGLAALGVVQALPNRHAVQSQLTDRSTRALSAAGITDARVQFDGRDATVHVRSSGDRDRALAVVRSQQGVRVAHVVVDRTAPSTTASTTPSEPPTKTPNATPNPTAPRTATGETVARVQAAVDELGPIQFASASAALTPTGRKLVGNVAAILRSDASVEVEIEGFTDAIGPAAANLTLSRSRARTVFDTLRVLGIPMARMTHAGYGESRPRVPNDSRAHRAVNRRVTFVVRPGTSR